MEFYSAIVVKLLLGLVLAGASFARPLESVDYRQYQNNGGGDAEGGGNSYESAAAAAALMSPATFASSQNGGFSSLANPSDLFMPQTIGQSSSMNAYGNPFGGQSYGASNFGVPAGGYPGMAGSYFGRK